VTRLANVSGKDAVRVSERFGYVLLKEGDVLEGAEVVPGWALPVAEIFR
jgi:hypothetical protein